uniref:Uncharacterized protein n=1 Tax=Plectus sambesii TaxID=2011161 RepID=A0A914VMP5_9BILA
MRRRRSEGGMRAKRGIGRHLYALKRVLPETGGAICRGLVSASRGRVAIATPIMAGRRSVQWTAVATHPSTSYNGAKEARIVPPTKAGARISRRVSQIYEAVALCRRVWPKD